MNKKHFNRLTPKLLGVALASLAALPAAADQTYFRLNTNQEYICSTDAEDCIFYRYSLKAYDSPNSSRDEAYPETCPTEVDILGEFSISTSSNAAYNHNYVTKTIFRAAFQYSLSDKYDRELLISSIQSINIPNTVTTIQDLAFDGCSGLKSIVIPESVTSIGSSVLSNCTSLQTAVVKGYDGTTYGVPTSLFENCTALKSVTFERDMFGIGASAFKGCTSLTDITFMGINDNMGAIASDAFEGVDMSQVTIHVPLGTEAKYANLVSLGATVTGPEIPTNFAIDGINYIVTSTSPLQVYVGHQSAQITTPVVIPATVTYDDYTFAVVGVQHHAFDACEHIPSITLPEGLQVIGASAFSRCAALKSLTIPSTVTTLGCDHDYGTFLATMFDNSGITSITIPASVTSIGAGVLYSMPNLTEATINANITALPDMMFRGSGKLQTLHLNSPITSVGTDVFTGVNLSELNVTVPAGSSLSDFQAIANLGVASITTEAGNTIYPAVSAVPTTAGWYHVQFIEKGTGYTNDATSTSLLGTYALTKEEELQYNSDDYSFMFGEIPAGKEARALVWLEPVGNSFKVKSINGHYPNNKAIATRNGGAAFDITVQNEELGYVTFAGGWTPFACNDSDGNFWGLSTKSLDERNRYLVTPVDVSEYDIYNVVIENATNGNRVKNDMRVTCSNDANAGIAAVFNGGHFFFPAGTAVSVADFSAPEQNGVTPTITIDVETKTITADYTLEGQYNFYKSQYEASLIASGLFAENTEFNLPQWDDAQTLDENKENVVAAAHNLLRPVLNGKKVYLRTASNNTNSNHGYLTASASVPTHHETFNLTGVWTVTYDANNQVSLYNEVYKKYMSCTNPAGTGDDFNMSDTALKFGVLFSPGNSSTQSGHFAFSATGESDVPGYHYFHAKSGTTIGKWGNAGDGSYWKFYLIDDETAQSHIDGVRALVSPAATPLGTNPGEWQDANHPELFDYLQTLDNMTAADIDYATLFDISNAMASATFTQNLVEAGRYYRIRTSAQNAALDRGLDAYLSNQSYASSLGFIPVANITDDNINNTIFFTAPTDDESKFYLICHGDGKYVYATTTNASPFLRMSTAAEVASLDVAPDYAVKAYFNPVGATEATSMIFFFTTPAATRSVHAWTVNNNTNYLKADMCGYNPSDGAYHHYSIERVDELPVKINAQGYGSLIAPVAVKFSNLNVDHYTIYLQNQASDDIEFDVLESLDTEIPAGTPILIKGVAGTSVNATVVYDAAATAALLAETADEPNAHVLSELVTLHGSHITTTHSATEGMITLALAENADSYNPTDTEVYFTKVDNGSELSGNTLYITVPGNINQLLKGNKFLSEDQSYGVIDLSAGLTTSINDVMINDNNNSEIYDLQGRRLAVRVKGINIVNGKKILVK